MEYVELDPQNIAAGFYEDTSKGGYICTTCEALFEEGEMYEVGGRYYSHCRAAKEHVAHSHPEHFTTLLRDAGKYNTLTDTQRNLLELFAAGLPDADIAKQLGISASTVRHQKFTFREKAKSARLYLALYTMALENESGDDRLMPIHTHATMVDDRYVITEAEREKMLGQLFTSLSPLKLKVCLPPKEKKKVVILSRIAEEFDKSARYSEKQVNEILKAIHEDYVTLRRYLISYGFMDRTRDGREYWMK